MLINMTGNKNAQLMLTWILVILGVISFCCGVYGGVTLVDDFISMKYGYKILS